MSRYLVLLILNLLFLRVVISEKNLYIHAIPHSHNDAGWLESFEEYYHDKTEHILTHVIQCLYQDKSRTFHWADIAFFDKWWSQQTDENKRITIQLIEENRFMFIGGGWVMNDEALPSYKEMLLQMRLGLDFLQDNFGVRPNIAWQIDPFGSSAVTVAVLYKLGYDGFVGNRMSQTFKDKMAEEDGFNFYWQGHQVSKDPEECVLFTHILQKHYGLELPNVWNEVKFLNSSMDRIQDYVYQREIQPAIDAIDSISDHHTIEYSQCLENMNLDEDGTCSIDYHTLIATGDDFFYKNATAVFKKFDRLLMDLGRNGAFHTFDTEINYSTLADYFRGLHTMNLTYGLYKGDFLPYSEKLENGRSFWSGYYSMRLHLKQNIRYVFNQIQATKTLMAMKALDINHGTVLFSDNLKGILEEINYLITQAERKWAIMMHHDAITGTHTVHTEPSYYRILISSQRYLSDALNLINTQLSVAVSDEIQGYFKDIFIKFDSPMINEYSFTNTIGYNRESLVNITLSESENIEGGHFLLIQANSSIKVLELDSYITTFTELDEETRQIKEVIKLWIPNFPFLSLSETKIYHVITRSEADCFKPGIKCSIKVSEKEIKSSEWENHGFNSDGDLDSFRIYSSSKDYEEISESYSYYNTSVNMTHSGLYTFNPLQEPTPMVFSHTRMNSYSLGKLRVIQVIKDNNSDVIIKSYINFKDEDHQSNHLFMQVQVGSDQIQEITLNIDRKVKKSQSVHSAFVDDSLKLVQRPIYDENTDLPVNKTELIGFYTYPCVQGGVLREEYHRNFNEKIQWFLGWANSQPIGCSISDKNSVDFMIFRSIGNNDNKGVTDIVHDTHITTTSFDFYSSKSLDTFIQKKNKLVSEIVDPVFALSTKRIRYAEIPSISTVTSLARTLLKESHHLGELSKNYCEIEIANLRLKQHTLMVNTSDYELDLVLMNRSPNPRALHFGHTNDDRAFKTSLIDIIKQPDQESFSESFKNNLNKSKRILDEERYELRTLEQEFSPEDGDYGQGLEEFELAQFRIVPYELYVEMVEQVEGQSVLVNILSVITKLLGACVVFSLIIICIMQCFSGKDKKKKFKTV